MKRLKNTKTKRLNIIYTHYHNWWINSVNIIKVCTHCCTEETQNKKGVSINISALSAGVCILIFIY